MDFTSLENQIDGLQRVGGTESFIEFFEDQKRRSGGHRACFRITPALLRLIHRPLLVRQAKEFPRKNCSPDIGISFLTAG